MSQLKISLPDDFRARLDAASAKSGRSLAEEIRGRVERTFDQDETDAAMRDLLAHIDSLAGFVRLQTGRAWYADAGAHRIFQRAIAARLARLRPEGEAPELDEKPVRLIASDNPDEIALGLEALELHSPAADDPRLKAAIEASTAEMRKLHKGEKS